MNGLSPIIPTLSTLPPSDPDAVTTHALSLHAELHALRLAIMRGDGHADLLRAVDAASDTLDELTDAIDSKI